MKHLNALCLCVALLVCSSCTNIKSKKVTEENKEKVLSEISTSSELTNEEKQLLLGYFMRQNMATIFQGGKPGLPTGKTLGEMIQDQKKWVAQEKEEEERQKHLAAEIAGKQAGVTGLLMSECVCNNGIVMGRRFYISAPRSISTVTRGRPGRVLFGFRTFFPQNSLPA